MKIINYNSHYIDKKDILSVAKVLQKEKITQGKKAKQFEKKICKIFKSKYCSVVSNGTAALHLSALALNFNKNDIVISSPITFLAGPNSVMYCGAKPFFVDINHKTYNIDVDKLEKKLVEFNLKKKKIKALIATDYAGQPCDWKKLKKLSIKYKFFLINDNCHAIGAKYDGDIGYAAKYADIVIHSYHAAKNITTGEGGAVLTNNKKIYEKIEIFKNHGLIKTNKKTLNPNWPYEMHELGFNYRLTDFQCALGISQLSKLKKFVKKRQEIAIKYYKKLKNFPNIVLPYLEKNISHSFHLFPITINFKNYNFNKNKLINFFRKKKIYLQSHYFPIYLQPFYKKKLKLKKNFLRNSEKYFESTVSLPIYLKLKDKEINYIVKLLKNKLKKNKLKMKSGSK